MKGHLKGPLGPKIALERILGVKPRTSDANASWVKKRGVNRKAWWSKHGDTVYVVILWAVTVIGFFLYITHDYKRDEPKRPQGIMSERPSRGE